MDLRFHYHPPHPYHHQYEMRVFPPHYHYHHNVTVLLLLIVNQVSMANYGVGGMSSAFQLLEISHTHFWTKVSISIQRTYQHSLSRAPPCSQDMLENMEYGLAPSASTTAPGSRDVSPYGSRENLHTTVYRGAGASLKVPRSHQHFLSPPSHRYSHQGAWEPACFHGRRGVQELVGGGERARQWEESQRQPGRSASQLDGGDVARVDPAEEVAAARQARLSQLRGGERRVQQHRGK